MAKVIHTCRATIRKHAGAHRTAKLEALDEPVHYGMHGGILEFYKAKYGVKVDREYPATLDHFVASVGG